MTELRILKNQAGGQISFGLMEGREEVASFPRIEDLAETIVSDYPEAAKEIVDLQRQAKKLDTGDDQAQIGGIFFWDIRPSERKEFCIAVHDLFVEEFSFVDMDPEE